MGLLSVSTDETGDLRRVLRQLPNDLRQAFVHRYLRGRRVPAIAARMNRTEKDVTALLSQGLRRIRELLDNWS